MILGWVKILNANVDFFKEAMRIKVRKTTRTVDSVANDVGRYITPMMSASTSSGGTFSNNCSIDFFV